MTHNDRREPKPKRTHRLAQLSKSNRLMRRFYSGKRPAPQSTPLARTISHVEEIY